MFSALERHHDARSNAWFCAVALAHIGPRPESAALRTLLPARILRCEGIAARGIDFDQPPRVVDYRVAAMPPEENGV
ncbi:MAG TPA: hypothetical protein VF814_01765 [Casimicrobiaceae bacterium]